MASLNVYVALRVLAIMAIGGAVMAQDVDQSKQMIVKTKKR